MGLSLDLTAFDPSLGLTEIGFVGSGFRLGPAEFSPFPCHLGNWMLMLQKQKGCPRTALQDTGPQSRDITSTGWSRKQLEAFLTCQLGSSRDFSHFQFLAFLF